MYGLFQDFRYALRSLRKNPGLTFVAVLSLGLGIGANSAIFSVVDALLLRPLPYPQPDRLANIWLHSPALGILRDWPSPGEFIDVRKENHSFEEMAIARLGSVTLTGRQQPERIDGMRASSNLLRLLGARPLLGRLLLPEDDTPGKPKVAILSYRLWRRLFNSDPHAVGAGIVLNGDSYTVAGVLRPEFALDTEVMPAEAPMEKLDIFLPLPLGADAARNRGDENYNVLARLKPGLSLAQAQADVDVIAARIREKDKRDRTFGMTVTGLEEQVVGDVRRAVLVLLGSVTLVLLIACANVANLLLTRAAGRRREVAIRAALGAGRARLVRQILAESVLLAAIGGAAGLAIAQCSLYVVRAMNPGNIPRLEAIGLNGAVLAFTLGISLVTGILFGLAPAFGTLRADLNASLKSGGRGVQNEGGMRLARHRLRGLLVVAELAFSLVLLAAAGLLIRSFVRLQSVAPGFAADHVLSLRVVASGPKYRQDRPVDEFFREVARRVAALPGVTSQGMVSALPFTGEVGWGQIGVEGYHPAPGQELQVDLRISTAGYFQAMRIPLLQGRLFAASDTIEGPALVIVDEKFAQRFWPHESAVGKHVWFDERKPITIAGVVGAVKQYGLDNDSKIAAYFLPHMKDFFSNSLYLAVRAAGDPSALSGAIVREIHSAEPDAVVYDVATMEKRVHRSLARRRFSASMLGAFAAFALLLAAVGVYGVISCLVSQNRRDIGIRVALGASRGNIFGMVIRQGLGLAGLGIAIGLAGAAALTRLMSGLLYGVSATDKITFCGVSVILAAAALAATVIPARRATSVDPMTTLREE